jgi:formamidopyrimidine-DNA glycosylase
MPELPEVETVRRALELRIRGKRIVSAEVRHPHLRRTLDTNAISCVQGRSFEAFRRRGKYLILDLSGDVSLVVHLGMSGRLLLCSSAEVFDKHDHVRITMHGGCELRFRDPRRFGSIAVWPTSEVMDRPPLAGLGIEPLAREFTPSRLEELVSGLRRPIKSLLMDQSRLAGIGNIYANEILFEARLYPFVPAGLLQPREIRKLHAAIVQTLRRAVERGGTTIRDYSDPLGQPGWFRLELAVYQRAGEPCPRCGALIRLVRASGRSTYFCPSCQAPPNGG